MFQVFVIAFYLIALLYSIILHEISHGVVALWLGDKTAKYAGRLSLEPMRHVDPIGSVILPIGMILMTGFAFGWAKPVPYNPYNLKWTRWGGTAVAFAGPITNFLLALIAAIGASFINVPLEQKYMVIGNLMSTQWDQLVSSVTGSPGMLLYTIFAMIIFWNVLLGTFNLMPVPPLDGSKLIFATFKIPPQVQMFLEQWGFFIVLLLIMIPAVSAPFHALLMNLWGIFFNISL